MKKYIFLFITLLSISACALCACYVHVVGNTYTTIYGIKMTFEYEDTTIKATDDVYNLEIGNTYTLEISLIQGGGSTPAGIAGDCVTFENSDTVAITYAGDNGGSVVYNITGYTVATEVVTAYMGTYTCSATINWQQTSL